MYIISRESKIYVLVEVLKWPDLHLILLVGAQYACSTEEK